MTFDRRAQGKRPQDNVRLRACSNLVGQLAREGRHGAGLGRQLCEPPRPLGRSLRHSLERGRDDVEGAVKAEPGCRSGTPTLVDAARRVADEDRRIPDSSKRREAERLGDLLQAGVLEGEEMAGEVAAVHRRHVPGMERPAVSGVVPVEEVSAKALEPAHRSEGGLESIEGVERPEPAEVVRGHHAQEVKAHVRGGRSVRHHRTGRLLEVVGRQSVIVGTDERREKSPGPAADQPESLAGRGRQRLRLGGAPGHADRSRHQGRYGPEQQERHRDGQNHRPEPPDGHARNDSKGHSPAHPQVETAEVEADARLRLGGGHPLQEMTMGHVEAHERAEHRVAHQPGLVRQHGDRDGRLGDGEPQVPADRAGVATLRKPVPPGNQPGDDRDERGQDDGRQHECGPRERRGGRQRPSEHQGREGGGRRQRAPQVVQHLPAPDQRHSARENPREELPVTARPAVLTGGGDAIVRRSGLEQLDVGAEAGSGEEALEEIVAQQRVLGHASGQSRLERIHVVDAFARV